MSKAHDLTTGVDLPDRDGRLVRFRLLTPDDDLNALTDLLHAAYAPLAEAGMRFVASHQSVEVTRQRVQSGDTIVAVLDIGIIGTVTLNAATKISGSPFYQRTDAANVGQFAVLPAMQDRRIGSMLMDLAEARAKELGYAYVVLNTSEHAERLIGFYERRGYRFIEHTRWAAVNYRSVVMAKAL
jgi:ribosomal protein S18 acetylase RimI-like enzyme